MVSLESLVLGLIESGLSYELSWTVPAVLQAFQAGIGPIEASIGVLPHSPVPSRISFRIKVGRSVTIVFYDSLAMDLTAKRLENASSGLFVAKRLFVKKSRFQSASILTRRRTSTRVQSGDCRLSSRWRNIPRTFAEKLGFLKIEASTW